MIAIESVHKKNWAPIITLFNHLGTVGCTKGQPINSEQENQDHQRTAQQCVYLAELKLTQTIKNNTVDIVHAMCTGFNDKVICMNTYYSKCFNPRVAQQSTNQYIGNQLKTILNHSNILDVQKFLHCSVFQSYFQDKIELTQAPKCILSLVKFSGMTTSEIKLC
ncbi:unnamed protein product [Lepeophtheirus salmonis]|uniref:(salmon louse) hypothetical protein n=1 Tax=Lepeophtheirus salmonis TaxID=72036 RepID=A0A7R8CK21_LEPSM|nr:unnamed protein product [Lepeophtheirus salmonis]CAF2841674.1 unnamed protein product [Lepeophtheirus salmonis]